MELRQLTTFLTIARLGSFIQAADSLGYAQSTITSHIQALETEFGVRLFERLGHRVSLTAQGKSLLPYAEKVMKLTHEAKEVVAATDTPQGRLTIGTGESLSTYRLPTFLHEYRRACPKVEMIFRFANCSAIRDCIRQNEIDVGFIINRKIADPDLVIDQISHEPMLFLAAPDHPLAAGPVSPQALAETCLILTEPGCSYRATIEGILTEYRVTPRSCLEVSSIESIKQFIMIGLGISMLPRFAVEKELRNQQMAVVDWQLPIPQYMVQLVYHKDKWISPALYSFLEKVRESFTTNADNAESHGQPRFGR